MFDVLCIGILVADAVAKPVDSMPEKGKLSLVDKLELFTGGCAANTAIDIAKIGMSAAIIGKMGEDGFGKFMLNAIRDESVDINGLVLDNSVTTSASVVISNSDGERTFLHSLGANAEFTYEDINFDIVRKSTIVFVAGTMLMPKFDGEPCARFLRKAREMGKITVLDTAWDSTGRWMDVLRPCMEFIDYFVPSYDEAVMLSGKKEPEDIANVFLNMGVKTVVIKMGKDGCYIKSSNGEEHCISTYTDINVVDTNGAGDSFVAGFITGLSKKWSLYECGRFANAVGTHCVMAMGASTGIKSLDEIMKFMKDRE